MRKPWQKAQALRRWWSRLRGQPWMRPVEGFARQLVLQLRRDQALKSAATLAYMTLLALVPLLTIGFSVLAAFPVFEDVIDRLRTAMIANLVPAAGEVVEEHLERFMGRAAELTAVGIVGLAATALLLMNAVERILNEIWDVHRPRPLLQRFMMYWTVLTMGPLLIGVSAVATTQLAGIGMPGAVGDDEGRVGVLVGLFLPFVIQALAFALLYAVVPFRNVLVSHALIGGATASVAFEAAKLGFGWFVAWVPTYEAVYGALAALPIFLIWLYISWLIVLAGAEITRALRGFRRFTSERPPAQGGRELILMLHVLGYLYAAQRDGAGRSLEELLRLEPGAGDVELEELLDRLHREGVVERAADGRWFLACDLGRWKLADLHRRYAFALPHPGDVAGGDGPGDERLAEVLRPGEGELEGAFDVPLDAFFTKEARRSEENAEHPKTGEVS